MVALSTGLALAACTGADSVGSGQPPSNPVASRAAITSIATAGAGTALAALARLPVKGRAPMTGYSRAEFGPAWTDDTGAPLGHNGCDTRNDVLRRDLTGVSFKSGHCVVATGAELDPYTGTAINFVRGPKSSVIQIDHVASLGDVWQTGAQKLPAAIRRALANDPLNLIAADGPANEQKGDSDAASWLPANKAFRCTYVARQIAVKVKYHLWVTSAEKSAMSRVLAGCPAQKLPTAADALVRTYTGSAGGPAPAPSRSKSAPKPASLSTAVSYANCDAVRAAGAAPLHRGDPGYSTTLDRDGDGVACE